MELLSSSRPSAAHSSTRRIWLLAPLSLAAAASWYLTRKSPLPNPSESGTGEGVRIVLFSDSGERLQTIQVKKIVKPLPAWLRQLGPESFAVSRQQATEFSFHNAYWNNHKAGIYRCICCGNAVFSSKDKFDSDTGWPSFTAPITSENISTKADHTLGLERIEVVCKKCDGHLGHLFDDGPPPTHNRYCLNSAALRFMQAYGF